MSLRICIHILWHPEAHQPSAADGLSSSSAYVLLPCFYFRPHLGNRMKCVCERANNAASYIQRRQQNVWYGHSANMEIYQIPAPKINRMQTRKCSAKMFEPSERAFRSLVFSVSHVCCERVCDVFKWLSCPQQRIFRFLYFLFLSLCLSLGREHDD